MNIILDILAVPEYPSDAISHWGFVIFSERALIHNPETTSEVEHRRIALLIAKELAEQVRLMFQFLFLKYFYF